MTGLVFLGDRLQVHTRLETGEQMMAQLARGQVAFTNGDSVQVSWRPEDEMHFDES
ncbi:MAG: TOBE domain-containing protein [Acidobacteriia bacterium]|nr:TOBE domain-containing protein [Terriglobia bacterium]